VKLDARLLHARGARPDRPAPVDIISVHHARPGVAALEATVAAQVGELAVHHAAPAALDDRPPRFAALPVA
jgi:hypothetical protein